MNHAMGRLDYISVQCQYIICKAFVWRMECEKGPSQGLAGPLEGPGVGVGLGAGRLYSLIYWDQQD